MFTDAMIYGSIRPCSSRDSKWSERTTFKLAKGKGELARKAKQMKKLIREGERLRNKKGKGGRN